MVDFETSDMKDMPYKYNGITFEKDGGGGILLHQKEYLANKLARSACEHIIVSTKGDDDESVV